MKPFELVVAEHGSTVLRVCRAVLGPVDAEDAWSETFLAALRAYPRLAPKSSVRGWLVTIAHRKAIDIHRKRSRGPVLVERLPERALTDLSPEPRRLDLRAALRRLPRRQREAVLYHHLAELPYKEVAAITGSSPGAVRRAAADAIATLRKLLRGEKASKGRKR